VHHARFTFPFDEPPGWTPWAAWIDSPPPGSSPVGLATYQHRSGPGRWSVGGSVDPALVAWDVGREAAVAASRKVVLAHVRERLALEPRVVDTLYCNHEPDAGDGVAFRRAGPVLTVHGENLMKFAPVLGEGLAAAVLHDRTPTVRELAGG
jgi:sarcosine oxidase